MTKKILVVDDDPDVRTFVVTVLEENGYTPVIAHDGVEGLERIQKDHPDLVILDVLMPRGSGIRLYHTLKTDKALEAIPVIMLTGIALRSFLKSQKVLSEFKGDAVPEPDVYLEKPVEPEDLVRAIEKKLGKRA
jgi:CheY-like chemotaxis protein